MDNNKFEDELFETNGPYQYLRFLAFSYYAEFDVDVNGEEFCCGLSEPGYNLYYEIRNGKAVFPFLKEKYDADVDIQNSLAAMGLDPEKFWYALLYAYHAEETWNTDCIALTPAVQEHVEPLIAALRDEGVTISVQRPGKKKYVVSDPVAVSYVLKMLEEGDQKYESIAGYVYRSGRLLSRREDISVKWQMLDLYEVMVRVIEHFRTDKDLPKRVKGQIGSRDKDLLISRLLHLVKLADSESFKKGVNSLHAVKKYCRENSRPLMSSTYEFDHGQHHDTDKNADTSSDTDTDKSTDGGPTLLVDR